MPNLWDGSRRTVHARCEPLRLFPHHVSQLKQVTCQDTTSLGAKKVYSTCRRSDVTVPLEIRYRVVDQVSG